MSLNPDVQEKAQAELDAVVGPHRLPNPQDRVSLPYLDAILKECLRWHNVGPFGNPRCTQEDIEYRGYLIPKGTTLIANVWHVLVPLPTLVLSLMGLPTCPTGLVCTTRRYTRTRIASCPTDLCAAANWTQTFAIQATSCSVLAEGESTLEFCPSQTPFTQSSILAGLSRIGYVPDGASQRWRCSRSSRWSSTYSTSLPHSMRPGNLSSSTPEGGDPCSCECVYTCGIRGSLS